MTYLLVRAAEAGPGERRKKRMGGGAVQVGTHVTGHRIGRAAAVGGVAVGLLLGPVLPAGAAPPTPSGGTTSVGSPTTAGSITTPPGTTSAGSPTTAGAPATTAAADDAPEIAGVEQCVFGSKPVKGTPWSLQRVLLDQLWQDTKGKGVTVAVIDTGVDDTNEQLRGAVDSAHGRDYLTGEGDGTDDEVGHGTKVAGIIAARPMEDTGFVGLAPEATILPLRQNDAQNSGKADKMAEAVDYAVEQGAEVINISQDTTQVLGPGSKLHDAIENAVEEDVVVVASAGNDGADGKQRNTYPASLPGVLAVGASDRNNERAPFSQAGEFVDIAAPGVDMLSTVPKGGQCLDNGTSFSAPYVSGVVALLRAKHPDWRNNEVIAQIQQTAQRTGLGHDPFTGWGVIDPVKALTEDGKRIQEPVPDTNAVSSEHRIMPRRLTLEETPQERKERIATYVLGAALALVVLLAGASVALRDWRRKRA